VAGVLREISSQVHAGTLSRQYHGHFGKSWAMALQQGLGKAIEKGAHEQEGGR
jgi:hypothetical protein